MLNQIVLMGRLTRDPERRYTENGKAVTSFTLAVERDRVQQGQERQVDFIDCVSWNGLAETIFKYCKKGQLIAVTGRLQIRPWTDRDGNKHKATEVIVGSMHFAGGSKSDKQTADDEQAYTPAPFTVCQESLSILHCRYFYPHTLCSNSYPCESRNTICCKRESLESSLYLLPSLTTPSYIPLMR